ncbi:MAG: NADH-quinone oxidoreductase subunit N [Opitutaceae bacterium]|jgi:NADH-quinone oxidoreductase subunit N|nr:NADH-quinone oxidoreductase subunit N [Opitutaceae bacterium]
MTTEFFQNLARTTNNGWVLITPEILLACLALLLLVLDLALPRTLRRLIPAFAVGGLACALAVTVLWVLAPFNERILGVPVFNGMLRFTPHSQFMRVFFVLAALLTGVLGLVALKRRELPRIEFFHLVLVITAAMMLLGASGNFVMLFVALETVTVGFYILVACVRSSPLSLEAGLKYLVTGALSSGLLLFGIVLLHGVAGDPALEGYAPAANGLGFGRIFHTLDLNPGNFIGNLGAVLVLCGVAFKIGLVPFQIWIPDVYQGAPTPVTAFLSVGSKAAGFAVLITLLPVFHGVLGAGGRPGAVAPLLMVMTFATIVFGNLAALTQHNVKRLIGLSGVAHAGFMMTGLLAFMHGGTAGLGAVYVYLIAYLLASFAVFGVMVHVTGADDAVQELEHYHGLSRRSPLLAGVLAAGLGSLAGIPPLAGFMGKLLVFVGAFQAGLHWLLGVAIAGVVVSIYYYFGWLRAAFFQNWESPDAPGDVLERPAPAPVHPGVAAVLIVLALGSLVLGVWQTPVTRWLQVLGV